MSEYQWEIKIIRKKNLKIKLFNGNRVLWNGSIYILFEMLKKNLLNSFATRAGNEITEVESFLYLVKYQIVSFVLLIVSFGEIIWFYLFPTPLSLSVTLHIVLDLLYVNLILKYHNIIFYHYE